MSKQNVGGQALIEGVMMKSEKAKSIAIRKQDDSILVTSEDIKSSKYSKLKKIPFLRGMFVLVESMVEGTKDINYAASFYAEDDSDEVDLFEKIMVKLFKDKAEKAATMISVIFAFAIAIGLFIVLPAFLVKGSNEDATMFSSLKEGLIKISFFVAYIYIISFMNDIKRVFQYHGAEHKTIFAYEAGLPLEVANVRGFTTLHPRCGTNFLMIVMIISMFVFTFLGWPNLLERILSRIILMPVIAGISYEIIRYAGTHIEHNWVRTAILPGLYLQKLTTREPDDSQIEVAIAALKAVLPEEEPALVAAEVSLGEE